MLCCRVVLSCPSGGVGGEVTSSKVLGRVFWLAGGGRAQGSEFLGAVGVWPAVGCGVSAECCGGWKGGLSAVLSAVCTLHPAGSGTSAHALEGEVGGTESEAPLSPQHSLSG